MERQQAATVFVDGCYLKRHILRSGLQHTPQIVTQYLSHMVGEVRRLYPDVLIYINYYGVNMSEPVALPVSGRMFCDSNFRMNFNHHSIPGAWLHNTWGKMSYPYEQPWILKPKSMKKEKLSDHDFVFNEHPKGVLTQLVDAFTAAAITHPEDISFVYADPDEVESVLQSAKYMGAQVKRMALNGKVVEVTEVHSSGKGEPFLNRDLLRQTALALQQEPAPETEVLKNLRAAYPVDKQERVLMIDLGCVRKLLLSRKCQMNLENLQQVLDQVHEKLPEPATRTILYGGFLTSRRLIDPIPGDEDIVVDITSDKNILNLPNVEFCMGKTMQDKDYPTIVKWESRFVPPAQRQKNDYVYNIHQYGVDPMLARSLAYARFNPAAVEAYVLTGDGDFACSVDQAVKAGLKVTVVHLSDDEPSLSYRLEKCASDVVKVELDWAKLKTTSQEFFEGIHHQKAVKKSRLKARQRELRNWARRSDDYQG